MADARHVRLVRQITAATATAVMAQLVSATTAELVIDVSNVILIQATLARTVIHLAIKDRQISHAQTATEPAILASQAA